MKDRYSLLHSMTKRKYDLVVVALFMCSAAVLAYFALEKLLATEILSAKSASSWFEADISRVFENMTDRSSNHYRTKVHPLFSLTSHSFVFFLQQTFNLSAKVSVQLVFTSVAGLWAGCIYVLMRLITQRFLEATLFSLLALLSAASVFSLSVPETYSFGSVTIVVALGTVLVARYRPLSEWWYLLMSAGTLSFTSTNWMAGIFATYVEKPWKRTVQLSINAFFVVTILWGIQNRYFPSSEFFIGDREEARYLNFSFSHFYQSIISFFFHSMVMPEFQIVDKFNRPSWPVLVTQTSLPGIHSTQAGIACLLWGGLLTLGVVSLFRAKKHYQFRLMLSMLIVGQLCVHCFYGDETFLYSLHFLPLLIGLASLSTLCFPRKLILSMLFLLIITMSKNNLEQFFNAISFFVAHSS